MVREANASITPTKNKIDIEKLHKSKTCPERVVTTKNNKNITVDKADKPRSIPVTNIYNKSYQI